jgi:hypothetical protein
MMRELRRLHRMHGWTPFGVLLIVLLAVLVLADGATDRWAAAVQRRDDLQKQLGSMRATIERGRQIDLALESSRGRLAAAAGKFVIAPDSKTAGQLLAEATEKWLVSMGATSKGATGTQNPGHTKPAVAVAEVSIRVMPQQLLRILGEWQKAPQAMHLVRLDLTVDNPGSPTALEALLRVEAAFQAPQSAEPERATRGPSERRLAKKQDSQ